MEWSFEKFCKFHCRRFKNTSRILLESHWYVRSYLSVSRIESCFEDGISSDSRSQRILVWISSAFPLAIRYNFDVRSGVKVIRRGQKTSSEDNGFVLTLALLLQNQETSWVKCAFDYTERLCYAELILMKIDFSLEFVIYFDFNEAVFYWFDVIILRIDFSTELFDFLHNNST